MISAKVRLIRPCLVREQPPLPVSLFACGRVWTAYPPSYYAIMPQLLRRAVQWRVAAPARRGCPDGCTAPGSPMPCSIGLCDRVHETAAVELSAPSAASVRLDRMAGARGGTPALCSHQGSLVLAWGGNDAT